MKRKIIISFYIISLTLVVLSLARIFLGKYVKYPYLQEIKSVKIVDLNNDSLTLSLSIEIFNPNSFTQKINGGYFHISKNVEIIGNAKFIKEFSIKPDTSGIVELVVSLKTLELTKNLLEKTKHLEIKLVGEINSKVLLFNINPIVNLPFKINIFEILTNCLENDSKKQKIIRINSTRIDDLKIGTTNVTTNFTFINPYKIEFTLKSYPCKIYINNDYTGDGNILNSIIINNKQKQADGQFKFILNNFDVSKSIFQNFIQLNTKLNFETKGLLNLQILGYDISFPYNYHGELTRGLLGN